MNRRLKPQENLGLVHKLHQYNVMCCGSRFLSLSKKLRDNFLLENDKMACVVACCDQARAELDVKWPNNTVPEDNHI